MRSPSAFSSSQRYEARTSVYYVRPLALRDAYARAVRRVERRARWLTWWRRTMARDAFVMFLAAIVLAAFGLLQWCGTRH